MDRTAILNTYVTDMAAVETHIRDAVKGQVDSDDSARYPFAKETLTRLHGILDRHVAALEAYNEGTDGGGVKEAVKEAVGTALGFAAGLYNQIRPNDKVSRMVRDTYTATSLAVIAYHMLYTTALALKDSHLSDLAMAHLKDLTPVIGELSEDVCRVVAAELYDEDKSLDPTVGDQAVRNTQRAWKPEVMDDPSV